MVSPLTHWLFRSVLFNYYRFVNFSVFPLLLISILVPLWLEKLLAMISIFLIYWYLFCGLTCGLSRRIFHVHLRRMYILLLLGGVFYWCLFIYLSYNILKSSTSCQPSATLFLFITESRVFILFVFSLLLISPLILVIFLQCPLLYKIYVIMVISWDI